jgi:carboxyl-terminal processing protease
VLFEKGFLFDYATQYVSKHPEPVDSRTFTLTDNEYQQFLSWMKDKNYAYKSYMEYQLQQFTEEAKKEKYFSDLKNQLELVSTRIAESKKNELVLHKDEIKMLLESEIVSRYHLERGSVEAGFKYDKDIKTATEILHANANYKKLLNIQ